VNLFVVGWSSDGRVPPGLAPRAVGALSSRLPFFPGERVQAWRPPSGTVEAAWIAHAGERVGGVRYVHAERTRLELFAGRPILWGSDGRADGRGPLDPSGNRNAPAGWEARLDGRCVIVRGDDDRRELLLWTDALGAYPVFVTRAAEATWFSNSAEVLRGLHGGRDLDPVALAGLLGGGWSLDGHPVWAAVRRLERGSVLRLSAGEPACRHLNLPTEEIRSRLGAELDATRAAGDLVECLRALADWPGRPSTLLLTGGRDSRLLVAAARAAGLTLPVFTAGAPGDADMEVAMTVRRLTGLDDRVQAGRRLAAASDPQLAARLLALATAGTAPLATPLELPLELGEGPLPVIHTGHGGEIARNNYGTGRGGLDELTELLYRRVVLPGPWRRELLCSRGRELVRRQVRDWAEAQLAAGLEIADVPDVFFAFRRLPNGIGPYHGAGEFANDHVSPLWSNRLLDHLLALSPAQRKSEQFHRRVLGVLAPELVAVPFADGRSWREDARPSQRRRRVARRLAAEAFRELRRRQGRASSRRRVRAPIAEVQRLTRAAVAARPDHAAWEVLERGRVDALLRRPPLALDWVGRDQIWRLATVFLPDELA